MQSNDRRKDHSKIVCILAQLAGIKLSRGGMSMDDGPSSHSSQIELLTVLMPEQMRAYPLTSSVLIQL